VRRAMPKTFGAGSTPVSNTLSTPSISDQGHHKPEMDVVDERDTLLMIRGSDEPFHTSIATRYPDRGAHAESVHGSNRPSATIAASEGHLGPQTDDLTRAREPMTHTYWTAVDLILD